MSKRLNQDPAQLAKTLADSGANMTLSLHRVLASFLAQVEGPEGFGTILANIVQDEAAPINSRINVANSMAKLLGMYGEAANTNTMIDDDQIIGKLKELDALESDASDDDSTD